MMCTGAPLTRLDKLLANRGAGSRKQVDSMIRAGLVSLDGQVVGKMGAKLKVPESAAPLVDGVPYPPLPLLVAYHKPVGVHSTMKDERGRPCLSHVLPPSWQQLHPIGRLDADTSGLLLFSSDGDLTHRLLHPKYEVEREYVATVENVVDDEALGVALRVGVETIEDGQPFVVQGKLLEVSGADVRLVVKEGKHRMVRRMLANCGHPVLELRRERYGDIWLGDLQESDSREITGDGIEWAKRMLTR